jgi:MFS family permease
MIRTQQKHIPFWWILVISSTTGVSALVEQCSGATLTFTLRKFTDDPVLIAFIGSINIAFNFLVAPYISWKSDRVWTPIGRRKPFFIAGWSLLVLALIAVPYSPSLWVLIIVVFLWQFGADFGYTGTWSPFFYEIVPVHQRGKAVVVKRLMTVISIICFNYVLIGQFDAIYNLRIGTNSFRVTGEQLIYSVTALLVFLAVLNISFFVKEMKPEKTLERERFNPVKYFKEVFAERQFFVIYLLLFCSVAMIAWLGQFSPLLITEQFGYTKKIYGSIETVTFIIDLAVCLPLAAFLVDRIDRFRIFQICIFIATIDSFAYWIYIKYFAAGGIPSFTEIVIFSLGHRLPSALGMLALEPYFFDLTPKEKMGTMNSGFLMLRGLLNVLVINGMGLWIKYYTVFSGSGKMDYSSSLLYLTLIGISGCAACVFFARLRSMGKIVEYGDIENGKS